jgi:hypothetical protein
LPQRAEFAAAHRQFFVAQLHDGRVSLAELACPFIVRRCRPP